MSPVERMYLDVKRLELSRAIGFGAFFLAVSLGLTEPSFGHGGESHGSSTTTLLSNLNTQNRSTSTSRFSFGASALYSQALQNSKADMSEDPKAAASSSQGGMAPTDLFGSINATYSLTSAFGLTAGLSFSQSSGIQDPTLGGQYTYRMKRGLAWINTISFSIPVSKQSRKESKVTTIQGTSGVVLQKSKWTLSAFAIGAVSTYAPQQEVRSSNSSLTLNGPGIDPNQEDDPYHHQFDHPEDAPENYRLGTSLGSRYALAKSVYLGTQYDLLRLERYYSNSTWLNELTIPKLSYTNSTFDAGLGFILHREYADLQFPNEPIVRLSFSVFL